MVIEHAAKKDISYLLTILLLTYFFFFINLGGYSLKEPDEGRYAEIPREMVEQGDYLVPHLNYVRYFEKPPLLYWATAVSYKLFGVNEWSFRFPNALAAFFCSVLLFYFGRKWFSGETGFFGAVILISSVGFFAMARIVTIDMLLTGLLFSAVVCFNEFYRERRSSYLYLFYASLAMATLAKGPVAPVLVGLSILVFLYTEKDLSFLKTLFNVRGLLLYAVIAAPWFVAISIKEKEFFQFFFIDQNILRFLTKKHHRSGPVYYFIPVLAAGMLPWSFFLPRAVMRAWRMKELRFLIIYSAVVFLFFSLSGSKLPPYILPVLPPLSLIMGRLFVSCRQGAVSAKKEIVVYIIFFVGVMVTFVLGVSGIFEKCVGVAPDVKEILENIRGLEIGMIAVSAAMILFLCVRRLSRFHLIFLALTGFSLAVVAMVLFYAGVIDGYKTSKHLARTINGLQPKAAMVVYYGSFAESLPFYTGRRIYIVGDRGELEMGAKYADAQAFFPDEKTLKDLFDSNEPVIAVMKRKRIPRFGEIVKSGFRVLDCQDNRCVVINRMPQSSDSSGSGS